MQCAYIWHHRLVIFFHACLRRHKCCSIRRPTNLYSNVVKAMKNYVNQVTWRLATTQRLALWNTSSSLQSGYFSWIRFANTLCQRKKSIPKANKPGFWFVLGSPSTTSHKKTVHQSLINMQHIGIANLFNLQIYLQNILSGLLNRSTWGAGALNNGTLSWFLGGKLSSESLAFKVPLLNDRRVLIQASLVLYTKLASIQLVIALVYD